MLPMLAGHFKFSIGDYLVQSLELTPKCSEIALNYFFSCKIKRLEHFRILSALRDPANFRV